jgi:hypothetical protein
MIELICVAVRSARMQDALRVAMLVGALDGYQFDNESLSHKYKAMADLKKTRKMNLTETSKRLKDCR